MFCSLMGALVWAAATTGGSSTTEVFEDSTFVMQRFSIAYQDPDPFDANHQWQANRLVGAYYGSANERVLETYLQVIPTQDNARVIFRREGWTIRGDEQSASDTIELDTDLVSGSDLSFTYVTIGLIQGGEVFAPDPALGNQIYLHNWSSTMAYDSTGAVELGDFVCVTDPSATLEFGAGTPIIKFGLFHEVDTRSSSGHSLTTGFDRVRFTVTTY